MTVACLSEGLSSGRLSMANLVQLYFGYACWVRLSLWLEKH